MAVFSFYHQKQQQESNNKKQSCQRTHTQPFTHVLTHTTVWWGIQDSPSTNKWGVCVMLMGSSKINMYVNMTTGMYRHTYICTLYKAYTCLWECVCFIAVLLLYALNNIGMYWQTGTINTGILFASGLLKNLVDGYGQIRVSGEFVTGWYNEVLLMEYQISTARNGYSTIDERLNFQI